MVHTLEGLCTHSEFIVHAHRVETIKSTYYVVCKVIMCPDPYFWYHSINDYEYNNLKKSEAVLAWKKRILKSYYLTFCNNFVSVTIDFA